MKILNKVICILGLVFVTSVAFAAPYLTSVFMQILVYSIFVLTVLEPAYRVWTKSLNS